MEENKKSVLERIAIITNELDTLKKDGKNEKQRYTFISESQIISAIKEKLFEHRIHPVYKFYDRKTILREGEGEKFVLDTMSLEVIFKDIDGSNGALAYTYECSGCDYNGDKGIYKATTGGIKYALMKTFMIESSDDPENDKQAEEVDLIPKHLREMPDDIRKEFTIMIEMEGLTKVDMVRWCTKHEWNWNKIRVSIEDYRVNQMNKDSK